MLYLIESSSPQRPLPEPESAECYSCGGPKDPGRRCRTCGDYRDKEEKG